MGRNNIKPVQVGAGLGSTTITNVGKNLVLAQQTPNLAKNPNVLKDAVSIKSFKEKHGKQQFKNYQFLEPGQGKQNRATFYKVPHLP